MCYLHATSVTYDAFVFGTLVLSTGTFPVSFGAENPLTEQAVLLRPIRAIVDRLRFLDLPERPTANVVWRSQLDLHRSIIIDSIIYTFSHDLFAPAF